MKVHLDDTSRQTMVSRRQAALGLLAVTLIWGGTFVWMKQILDAVDGRIDESGLTAIVALIVASRFALAALTLPLVSQKSRLGMMSKEAWKGGFILGLLMYLGFLTQMIALDSITPSVSAFLTSLYVVFTALIGSRMMGYTPTKVMIWGAVLATLGAGFIDGPPHLSWTWAELLTVTCALFFALHILATQRITTEMDPIEVSQTSFITVVILSALTFLFTMRDGLSELLSTLGDEGVVLPLLALGLGGSLICLLMLNLLQRHLHPTHAAVIYALEPVWATVYGLAIGIQPWSMWILAGGLTLVAGNIVVEIGAQHSEDAEPSKS